MELFGVQELPNSKSISAPGWAYVPDTGINPSIAALQPSRAKRVARILPNGSGHETTAKQDAKILRELAALDKENHKDVQIPVPIKHRNNAGRGIEPSSNIENHLANKIFLPQSVMAKLHRLSEKFYSLRKHSPTTFQMLRRSLPSPHPSLSLNLPLVPHSRRHPDHHLLWLLRH
jgi:hypothetical protein